MIGWPGIAVGIAIFLVVWIIVLVSTEKGNFTFEPTDGFLDKILPIYLDVAKFIMGLAAGGIVLIIGSSALSSTNKRLPPEYASPLLLLAMSIFYGIVFMPLLVLNYEAWKHNEYKYTRSRYIRNRTLGFSGLICFCLGYGWLILAAVG
jgi:hypothetical protein